VMQITRGAMNERERGDWGWAGSVWPTQTRTGWLSQAGWAGQASRPVALAGQVGRFGFCQLDLIQISNLKSNANFFMNSNQIQRFKYL
jgi:hypothetical protein